jgi:hypothetical protein
MMRFSANMTNDDPSKFDLVTVSRRQGYSPTVPLTLLATADLALDGVSHCDCS